MSVLNIGSTPNCTELPENIFQDDSAVQLNPQTTPEKKKIGMDKKKYELNILFSLTLN